MTKNVYVGSSVEDAFYEAHRRWATQRDSDPNHISTHELVEQVFATHGLLIVAMGESLKPPLPDYSGLISVAETAKRDGYPIHVATRTTCQQHIVAGDHIRPAFAFGQAALDAEQLIEESTANLIIAFRRWCKRRGVEPPTVEEYRSILEEAARLSQPPDPATSMEDRLGAAMFDATEADPATAHEEKR